MEIRIGFWMDVVRRNQPTLISGSSPSTTPSLSGTKQQLLAGSSAPEEQREMIAHFRKPFLGLFFSPLQGSLSEGRFHRVVFLTKRGIVYGGTVALVLMLLSLMATGMPDAKDAGNTWRTSVGGANAVPTTTISTPPLEANRLPPIHHDSEHQISTTSPTTLPSSTTTPVAASPPLSPPIHRPDVKHTEEGFPLISTHNNGKLVLLTGATGRGNFFEIPDFYSLIINNRLEYANRHGPTPSLLAFIPRKLTVRLRFDDGRFIVVCNYQDDTPSVGEITGHPRGISKVSDRRMGVVA